MTIPTITWTRETRPSGLPMYHAELGDSQAHISHGYFGGYRWCVITFDVLGRRGFSETLREAKNAAADALTSAN